jgi:MFS family permease
MMRDELQDTMMRYKRYDNIDGTGEMFMGLMLMGFALLGYLQTVLPEHSMWRTNFFGLLFMYAVLIPVLGAGYWLRRVIKQRITFPRTGYVAGHSLWRMMFAPRTDKNEVAPGTATRRAFWVAILSLTIVTAVVAAGFGYIMARQLHGALGFARVSYLAFWVPIYAFWVFRMGREHLWKWLVLLFMALGLVAIGLIVPGGFVELSRWVTLFVGLMWFVSGGATLYSYLRHTHPPASVTE